MKRNNSSFSRQRPTYTCRICEILTRETGDGESGCELCVDCFNLAGLANGVNDDGREPTADEAKEVVRRLSNIAKKGGNVEAVRNSLSYLLGALPAGARP